MNSDGFIGFKCRNQTAVTTIMRMYINKGTSFYEETTPQVAYSTLSTGIVPVKNGDIIDLYTQNANDYLYMFFIPNR